MAEKKTDPIEAPTNMEGINRRMAMPREIRTDDGRELIVVTWQPMYHRLEATIQVRLEAVVSMPNEADTNTERPGE